MTVRAVADLVCAACPAHLTACVRGFQGKSAIRVLLENTDDDDGALSLGTASPPCFDTEHNLMRTIITGLGQAQAQACLASHQP